MSFPKETTGKTRFDVLMECWRSGRSDRCLIVTAETVWEGERYLELHYNGDTMTLGGMTIHLSTEFLLCKVHEKEVKG
jgi:hypothetical protein